MTDDFRQLLAALGAALVSAFGDTAPAGPKPAPAAQPEPAPMKGKRAPMPRREKTCIVCGAAYMTASTRALLCPHCGILRTNGNAKFMAQFRAAKAKMQTQDAQPAPVADGTFDCPRMHARIRPDFCGSRDECWNGKPCEKTAGKTRPEGATKPWLEA